MLKSDFQLLQLPTTTCRALLTHYKWDSSRLIGEYFEFDQDIFFAQANVENPFNIEPPNTIDDSDDCKICYTEVTPDVSGFSFFHLRFFFVDVFNVIT